MQISLDVIKGKFCFAVHSQDVIKQHLKQKLLICECVMAKSENLDYAQYVRLSLLLFRIYFDTLINLHGDIIKNHTLRL